MQQQNPYMINKPQDVYRKQTILTASPAELIVMLYDGCRKDLALAKRAIEKGNMPDAHKFLMKAQDIIGYLVGCLDMRYEVSENLLDLYEFMLIELEKINVSKDASRIEPVMDMISELRGAWGTISDDLQKGQLSLAED